MKNKKRILSGLLAAALVVPLFAGGAQTAAAAEAAGKTLDVVFTHDTHSHLNSFSTVIDGESTEVGGFARIKTVIDEQKAENPDTLVVDGGDFPWVRWCRPSMRMRRRSSGCWAQSAVK